MKQVIAERLASLREVMREERLAAFIFPSTDPHNGEYVPDHWKSREWISGFSGSAGTAVVTMHSAALWTDSRYFIAAKEQLEGTEYVLMKERINGTPSIAEWIAHEISEGRSTEVGIDGTCCSVSYVRQLKEELHGNGGLTLRINLDPMARIWKDRPEIPLGPAVVHRKEWAGEDVTSKIDRIRRALIRNHAVGMLVSSLDDIAWTLNIRGTDVHCNPVVVAYLLISPDKVTLFIDQRKIDGKVGRHLNDNGIDIEEYGRTRESLARYNDYNILLDPSETSCLLAQAARCNIVEAPSPIPMLKAIKNDTELEGFRNVMVRDGVAMVKFLSRLDKWVRQGGLTEIEVDRRLTSFRKEQKGFRDLSFDTIAAYGAHGAIVHYEATEETDVELQPRGYILIDSGAQYDEGTTDITRTIALGPLTEEERRVYTLVLKGHIQLQLLKFPRGASGTQLDAIARMDLWKAGLNYMHGTGHGVGSCLNVHEGPHQIRMEYRGAPIYEGMTVTDEPGIYMEGKFGVRIENTLAVVPYMSTEFGEFLQFETLTLCPIDLSPVIPELLTAEEKSWLDSYHKRVYDSLSPYLDEEEKKWLMSVSHSI